eukprot:gene8369-908_t
MAQRTNRPAQSVPPEEIKNDAGGDSSKFHAECTLTAQIGAVSQAKGSAFVEIGSTKVIAACYGPVATSRRTGFKETCILECDVKFSPFASTKHLTSQQIPLERELSQQLASGLRSCICLSKYPKSIIQVYATVIQDDGEAFAAVINAASLALAHGGIEMYDLLSSSCVSISQDGNMQTHPTKKEELELEGSLLCAIMPSLTEITILQHTGRLSFDQFRKLCHGIKLFIDI